MDGSKVEAMKLSEQELNWVKRWEKRERLWLPVTRWICIFNGILSLALGIFIFQKLRTLSIPNAGCLFLIPILFLINSGVLFGVTLSKWQGDIKLRLLLRLIREHEDKDI